MFNENVIVNYLYKYINIDINKMFNKYSRKLITFYLFYKKLSKHMHVGEVYGYMCECDNSLIRNGLN